jgi:hypothetical protein
MLNLSNPNHKMFVEVDGKKFEVQALLPRTSGRVANALCATMPSWAIIDEELKSDLIIIANVKPTA